MTAKIDSPIIEAMRQSLLFVKTRHEAPRDEEAVNARLLIRAGFIDKVMAGVYSFLPLGLLVLKKIEKIIREEMVRIGGVEILMPTLQPKTNWETTGRFKNYDSLFKFASFYSKQDFVLGPTHEEIISPLMKKFILSYKDLPRYVFQIQNKFRDETRVKSGLLRGREFLMKDLYSFHPDAEDLDKYYEEVKNSYLKIFERVGIGAKTYLTFASGGTFSEYSHEFQTLTPAGEDDIYLCEKCLVAVNKEIIKEQKYCPQCGKDKFTAEKAVEVGNIFKLQTRYSEPFGLKYRTLSGKEKDVQMGCYGIGLNRLLGTIVEVFHDDQGIIWPRAVSPFSVHLIELSHRRTKTGSALKIYKSLQAKGIEVLYDDRSEATVGEKLVDADLLGIPWRAIVSEKTGDKIELKKRSGSQSVLVATDDLMGVVSAE